MEVLLKQTSLPNYPVPSQPDVLTNLLRECEDSAFWHNFKKAAPILFCMAVDSEQQAKQARDMSFIEELFKTKGILKVMKDKIDSGSADVDVVEYSLATKVLENKLAVLSATNTSTDKEDGTIVLNIEGTSKKMTINLEKLKEAITFSDGHEVQKAYNAEENKVQYEPIDASNLTPEEFIAKAAEKILPVRKTGKNLHKETFVKLFHYTGDYAKFRTTELKKEAQEKRLQHFQVDSKKYLEEMKATVAEEEKVYEQASKDLFEAVSISPEMFERS